MTLPNLDTVDTITALTDSVLAVAARADRPPLSIRVSASDFQIEAGWAEHPVATAAVPRQQPIAATSNGSAVHTVAAPIASGADTAPADTDSGSATFLLTASMVGVFYHAAEPGADPFVTVGATVVRGQQIGIIEAMKLMVPIEADRAGVVAEILVPDATAVEFGQPLLLLREADR
ncbi:acetyl-CoA carboxylase biotin carboxyl carrier protein subunit [Nocardia uniformis]|uniref:Biotin carboxyl carrier protein of acetyl-CoA carboxylase n=1 Tax=Nocardia uniformis TaxID=53432 RepID=A0A849BXD1_9NOCA|nr:biotin/lipoyl-containing protein [Nocardia uniformis]NNH68357.1 acetyl-CoA carboxylase biotin carboxyl carrier protein subunit [Nocardia uniformis]